jgi:ribonucleoside-diphosphate reductase alpha chain
MSKAASLVKRENTRVSKLLGINQAARTTTVKPAGTTSLTLGTSSGIHAWHNDYYVRRLRVGKNEAIYNYLLINHPELVEDEFFRPHDTAVIEIPQRAPKGSIMRTESPFQLLERVKKVATEWVNAGHRKGSNSHNVSATISLRDHEWDAAGEWMWENKKHYNGLSVLPYDGGSYIQAPFEDITEEKYYEMLNSLKDIDLSKVVELEDNTDLSGELACSGGQCEIDVELTPIEELSETQG